jgi:hypothetical protein
MQAQWRMKMRNVVITDKERAILAAALRYFRRRVEETHLLEELAAPYSPYKDIGDIATMKGRIAVPTPEELRSLENKLEEGMDRSLSAVIVLNGGCLIPSS